jgi:hypothetical protein
MNLDTALGRNKKKCRTNPAEKQSSVDHHARRFVSYDH